MRREVEKLFGEEKQQDYHKAMIEYIQTGNLPDNKKLREQFEHEQRQIKMMVATLPYSNKEECRRERTKVFGYDVCQKCESRGTNTANRCGVDNDNDEYGYLKDDEMEDDFKEESYTVD